MEPMTPRIRNTVLDTLDARGLAEFYRGLLGWAYREGEEPPPAGEPDVDGSDWLILRNPDGGAGLAFQQVERMPVSTWPAADIPQQLHLDFSVTSIDELTASRDRVLELGGTILDDTRRDAPEEPIYVFADPQGHPFCIFVV